MTVAEFLKRYGKLAAWATAAAVVPFVGAFTNLAPPAHPLTVATVVALAQLTVLVMTYQFLRRARQRTLSRVMAYSFGVFAAMSLLYFVLFRLFTVTLLDDTTRVIRGFTCNEVGLHHDRANCPWLGAEALNEVGNRSENLWTDPSINVAYLLLFSAWTAILLALAVLIGSFVVQRRVQIQT